MSVGNAEPVWNYRVELGHLARHEGEVVRAERNLGLAAERKLVAVVGAGLWFRTGVLLRSDGQG